MHRLTWLLVLITGCATPGAKYFEGEAETCADIDEARPYAEAHEADLTAEQRGELLVDTAHCQAEAGTSDIEPLLVQGTKLDPSLAGAADAERAALLAEADGGADAAVTKFEEARKEGFNDLELVANGKEFQSLLHLPAVERGLVELAASVDPMAPRVGALAEALGQHPISVAVAWANPKFGVGTFTLWHGRVLESHFDEDNNETDIVLEEMLAHEHEGNSDEAPQYQSLWTPEGGFTQVARNHSHEDGEDHYEWEATGRLFGLRIKGFPRELVDAPDLEVVGYYMGPSPFTLKSESGDAPTLDAIRAVPFNSGVHLGTQVAHTK